MHKIKLYELGNAPFDLDYDVDRETSQKLGVLTGKKNINGALTQFWKENSLIITAI